MSGKERNDALVLTITDGGKLGTFGKKINRELGGVIAKAIEDNNIFDGKTGQSLSLPTPFFDKYKRVILLGVGKKETLDQKSAKILGRILWKKLRHFSAEDADVRVDFGKDAPLSPAETAANMSHGLTLQSYRFDKYKTAGNDNRKLTTGDVDFVLKKDEQCEFKKHMVPLDSLSDGVFWASDLGNEPGNVIYPDSFAKQIRDEFDTPFDKTVKVRILDEKDMEKLGMGAVLAVGQGSKNPPRMVVMEYDGTNGRQKEPLALVGKGITFDTGGVSLKPSGSMTGMKYDMSGAAAVVGAMKALAGRKARTKVVGIVALAENMPGGGAYRQDDIIKSMNGKTIEVLNTDAEGRLALVDAMTYVQRMYKPKAMIDLATLTGAIVMALGNTQAGVFSNDDELAAKIEAAGRDSDERGYRMPLGEEYAAAIRGKSADLNNSGGRGAGASTAAEFLHAVVEDGVKWAHIDIAAMAHGNGFGVQLLDRLIADNYEQKGCCAPHKKKDAEHSCHTKAHKPKPPCCG